MLARHTAMLACAMGPSMVFGPLLFLVVCYCKSLLGGGCAVFNTEHMRAQVDDDTYGV
jgi:hypothetical protein